MLRILLASLALATAEPAPMPQGDDLHAAIVKHDAQLFWAAFEGCDTEALALLLTPDYRMVHDVRGLSIPSREEFIVRMNERCTARAPGGANEGYANRRLASPGSRRVQALGDWGALEEGHHNFFERQADGSWKLTGGGRYIHVWQWVGDRFQLSESISVDHSPALEYPPRSTDD